MDTARIRFFSGSAPLPEADELVEQLSKMVDAVDLRERPLLDELEQERRRAERLPEIAQARRDPDVD
jgi:hypothetical protein